jgi:hypothetical protein
MSSISLCMSFVPIWTDTGILGPRKSARQKKTDLIDLRVFDTHSNLTDETWKMRVLPRSPHQLATRTENEAANDTMEHRSEEIFILTHIHYV